MNLYEVIYWGSNGDPNAEDTIYLVRAATYSEAIEIVSLNTSPSNHNGVAEPLADMVHEIGVEARDADATDTPMILRGPYFQHAYNEGWRSWERKRYDAPPHDRDWALCSELRPKDPIDENSN